jgi:hypothetical protein
MTPKQKARYWREWGQIRKLLVEMGDFSKEDADAERMQIHERALGTGKSSKDLTNRHLDKIFDAFASYLVLLKGPSTAPAENQPCKRLIWAIEQLGLDESYMQSIALDQFKRADWRHLDEAQLSRFRFTCTARAAALKKSRP